MLSRLIILCLFYSEAKRNVELCVVTTCRCLFVYFLFFAKSIVELWTITTTRFHLSLPPFFLPRRGQLERRSHIAFYSALCYLRMQNSTSCCHLSRCFCVGANRNVELHAVTTSYVLHIIVFFVFLLRPTNRQLYMSPHHSVCFPVHCSVVW